MSRYYTHIGKEIRQMKTWTRKSVVFYYFGRWLTGIAEIVDGVVGTLTLGLVRTHFSIAVVFWSSGKLIEMEKKSRSKKSNVEETK